MVSHKTKRAALADEARRVTDELVALGLDADMLAVMTQKVRRVLGGVLEQEFRQLDMLHPRHKERVREDLLAAIEDSLGKAASGTLRGYARQFQAAAGGCETVEGRNALLGIANTLSAAI